MITEIQKKSSNDLRVLCNQHTLHPHAFFSLAAIFVDRGNGDNEQFTKGCIHKACRLKAPFKVAFEVFWCKMNDEIYRL